VLPEVLTVNGASRSEANAEDDENRPV
jgi:hypothetical protein